MKHVSPLGSGRRVAAMLVLLGLSAGCGRTDDLPRQPITGKVSFDGQPLTQAWIEFRPEGEGGITMAAAMVNEGGYSVPLADGLIPGKYRIAINKAEDPDEPQDAPLPKGVTKATKLRKATPSPFMFAKQLIPARYNTNSDIIKEVKADQPNDFNFELTSK